MAEEATIAQLEVQVVESSGRAASGLTSLARSLKDIKEAAKGGVGLTTVANQLTKFTSAMSGLKINDSGVKKLVQTMSRLSTIPKNNLGTMVNSLRKIPQVIEELEKADLEKFNQQVQTLTNIMAPLATEMEKVYNGFKVMPNAINKAASATTNYGKAVKNINFMGFVTKIRTTLAVVRRVANWVSDWIEESNDYVENLNLFRVAMGDYTDSAKEYAETVQEVLGIDSSEFMRYQAVFANMVKGFGVAADKGALMSKNLTQLGYDLASLYNVSFDKAMRKLESGIAGQPRPMREWGFDMSEATLKAKALELGIKKNVEVMNQGEKSLIRYVQLIDTARKIGATGDFARTLETNANQLRVMNAQLTLLKRSLGNTFIPILNKILPYAIALAQVLRYIADEFAALFGFTLPEIDYSSLTVGAEEAEDAWDSATDSANKYKATILGIDEINKLNEQNTGSGSSLATVGIGFDIDLPEYDFLAGAAESRAKVIADSWKAAIKPTMDWLKENWETVKIIAEAIGIVLIGWKVTKAISNLFNTIAGMSTGGKIALGITLSVVGIGLGYSAGESIAQGDFKNALLKTIGASISSALGGALIGYTIGGAYGAGIGAIISLGITLITSIVGIINGTDEVNKQNYINYVNSVLKKYGLNPEEYLESGIKASLDISTSIRQKISDISTDIPTEIKAKFESAQKLIDNIFSLDVKENLELIKRYADELNALGLDGINIRVNDDGTISKTKDELQGLLDNLIAVERAQALSNARQQAWVTVVEAKTSYEKAVETEMAAYNAYAKKKSELEKQGISRSSELTALEAALYSAQKNRKTIGSAFNKAKDAYVDIYNASNLGNTIKRGDVIALTGAIREYLDKGVTVAPAYSYVNPQTGEQYGETGYYNVEVEPKVNESALITQVSKGFESGIYDSSSKVEYVFADSFTNAFNSAWDGTEGTWRTSLEKVFNSATQMGISGVSFEDFADIFQSKVKSVMSSQGVSFSEAVKTALPQAIAEAFGNTDYTKFKEGIKNATGSGVTDGMNNAQYKAPLIKVFKEAFTEGLSYVNPRWLISKNGNEIALLPKALGGLVPAGGMFLAGEAGVEIIQSSMNGANVSNAVQLEEVFARAMQSVSGGMGGDWTIVVQDESGNVRSSQVITAAERANRRDGRTIIPVGVY